MKCSHKYVWVLVIDTDIYKSTMEFICSGFHLNIIKCTVIGNYMDLLNNNIQK